MEYAACAIAIAISPGTMKTSYVDAADLADPPAERQPEDDDEQKRGEHRRGDRLRPELEHAVGLARGEREQPAVAIERVRSPLRG